MVTTPRSGSIACDLSPACTTSKAGRAGDAALGILGAFLLETWVAGLSAKGSLTAALG